MSGGSTDHLPEDAPAPEKSAIFFNGESSRRRSVTVAFADAVELRESLNSTVLWQYDDIRRADSPSGVLRLNCLSAPALARLEIRDPALAAEVIAHCPRLDENRPGRGGAAAIVGWSLAAAASIIAMVWFGVPLAADRLTPLVPQSFERRLGDVADGQVRIMFGNKVCNGAAGQAAFTKLVNALRDAASLDPSVQTAVLETPIPNAFALPGGKVYLFNGLLARAQNPDEIAGVLAHELGHLRHRDGTRNLIYNGGTSFLIGLLFGDITGSGAMIFASRSLVTASYSREAEQRRRFFHRCDAPAGTADQADGRIAVPRHRQAGQQRPVDPDQPSVDRGSAAAHDPSGPAGQGAAAVDGGRMERAEGNLHRRRKIRQSIRRQDVTRKAQPRATFMGLRPRRLRQNPRIT
jgi:hypothetical protein